MPNIEEPLGKRSTSLSELLLSRLQRSGRETAYTWVGKTERSSVSWNGLISACLQLASKLRKYAGPEDRVALAVSPGFQFITGLFACWLADLVVVPLPRARGVRSAAQLSSIISDCTPKVILTDEPDWPFWHQCQGDSVLLTIQADVTAFVPGEPTTASNRSTVAMLQYTSGSTGRPRGVMLSHGNILSNLEAQYDRFAITERDRGVIWLPPHHDMGLSAGILHPLFSGIEMTLLDPLSVVQRPWRWLEAINNDRATISGGPPFGYDACVRALENQRRSEPDMAPLDLSCWRCAFVGAEPIRKGTLDRFAEALAPHGFERSAFSPCYGLAEATLIVTGASNRVTFFPDSYGNAQISNGVVVDKHSVVIVDPESRTAMPETRQGEIWVSGPSVGLGYWPRTNAPCSQFDGRLPNDGRRFCRTGDLGSLHGGELIVSGRIKDVIIIAARKYHAIDVEEAVSSAHPSLNGCRMAAFGATVDDVEQLVLIIERPNRQRPNDMVEAELIRHVKDAVWKALGIAIGQSMMVPPTTLPVTTSGKIRRDQCRQLYMGNAFEAWQRVRQ